MSYSSKSIIWGKWKDNDNQTHHQIDYVEEADGKITSFEFKWNPKARVKIPVNFVKTYDVQLEIISRENFMDFTGNKI